MIASLVRAGHRFNDIFYVRQPGWPYDGWSINQIIYWYGLSSKDNYDESIRNVSLTRLAIASVLDKKATKIFNSLVKQENA